MIDYDKFMNGTQNYIETEILKKINGYQKWLVGTAIGIGIKRADNIYEALANNQIISILGIIDENGMVDDDIIFEELRKQAHETSAVIELPLIGTITMNEDDIEKWHQYIHM